MVETTVRVPGPVAAVASRYHRLQLTLSAILALVTLALVAAVLFASPLWFGLVVAVVALGALRVPVFRTAGSARLTVDVSASVVEADFRGPTPPVLALQWGLADEVRETDQGAEYEFSFLFGIRSVTMETVVADTDEDETPPEPAADFEVRATVDGRPWGTYAISIEDEGDETAVAVTMAADRRFGLRRLPQLLAQLRYRDRALAALGYEVVRREGGLSV